jgi:hypothetical protein
MSLRDLLGAHPNDQIINDFIARAESSVTLPKHTHKVTTNVYPDSVYFNYHSLGFSLLFVPTDGYKPKSGTARDDLDQTRLILDGIDLYNLPFHKRKADSGTRGPDPKAGSTRSAEPTYADYPLYPVSIPLVAGAKDKNGVVKQRTVETLELTTTTSGKDFVGCLGEPDRKGGGGGPSQGSVNIWLEWSEDGIMIELGGDEARGPNAWEGGKDAVWKVFSLFRGKRG